MAPLIILSFLCQALNLLSPSQDFAASLLESGHLHNDSTAHPPAISNRQFQALISNDAGTQQTFPHGRWSEDCINQTSPAPQAGTVEVVLKRLS